MRRLLYLLMNAMNVLCCANVSIQFNEYKLTGSCWDCGDWMRLPLFILYDFVCFFLCVSCVYFFVYVFVYFVCVSVCVWVCVCVWISLTDLVIVSTWKTYHKYIRASTVWHDAVGIRSFHWFKQNFGVLIGDTCQKQSFLIFRKQGGHWNRLKLRHVLKYKYMWKMFLESMCNVCTNYI